VAKDEKLNEEGARNPNIPPTADPKDLVFLNRLADEKKQLPRGKKNRPDQD
jgi:hypothetical protein